MVFTLSGSFWTVTQQRQKSAWRFYSLSGWRNTAVCLTVIISTLTATLIICLIISLSRLGGGLGYGLRTSLLFKGDCQLSSRYNTWLHLAINTISSGVLASSNFFMQVMVAPTREDIDKAHARSRWVEIGVQSWRNLVYVPKRNAFYWALFAISSVPLHLIFNSCVLESRASTDFVMAVTSESFVDGASWSIPGVAMKQSQTSLEMTEVVTNMQKAISDPSPASIPWERISIDECVARYNNTGAILTTHRHVVMVISDPANSTGDGWATNDILFDPSRNGYLVTNESNALWYAEKFERTDYAAIERASSSYVYSYKYDSDFLTYMMTLDASTGIILGNQSVFRDGYSAMKAQYCLSEAFKVDCRLEVENKLLLIVCIFCLVKCTLCIVIVMTSGSQIPLITPGDAVESFITKPDAHTVGMCTFGRDNFINRQSGIIFTWLASPRAWVSRSRWSGIAVPMSIWLWSYCLIGISLIVAGAMCGISLREQEIGTSTFGHDSKNKPVLFGGTALDDTMLITIVANTPQLILSICYLAYNGLFTRMLSEFEWASFSVRYASLRVTHKKGQQRSTYRLQLPYRWSIPLLGISILLHWLYSNCIYVGIYEGYAWNQPLSPSSSLSIKSLQYSTVTIVISLCVSISVASAPIALALFKLPGKMVLAKNSSAAISAACHCIPTASSYDISYQDGVPLLPSKGETRHNANDEQELLREMATSKLRWGVVSNNLLERSEYYGEGNPGHLAFGTMEQHVTEPLDGNFYAASRL
ncbi:hypothetical protein CONLIGDRAFT_642048 [Coniochaeta ligniaria NRRL 30616]|uniref:DUF6536 domain-containing protein n=1 Tax=Coniochaeta ligniaria NRRL 30616 TaxID=1408157 RepID=A0A1J7IX89_9PEZI|nr:hypothetical protein CONLIGDRAFT_642048 [Coniochaeta ligniaria NRRL 30616]